MISERVRLALLYAALGLVVVASGCDPQRYLRGSPAAPELQEASRKYETGQISAALAELDKAIKARPSDPEVYLTVADWCLQHNQPHRAISYAERGLEATPGAPARIHAALYSVKGAALQTIGDLREAVAAHQAALKLVPEEPTFKNNVAYAMTELAESDPMLAHAESLAVEAVESAQSAGAEPATLGVFLDTLGWVQFKRGDLRQALVNLTRAADGAPDQPDILYHLALAYLAQGRRPDAIVMLERALKLKPNFAEASRRLSELRGTPEPRMTPR